MNGRRRFALCTILSIQDSSFTYLACQNCMSRVIRSSDRYECQKCSMVRPDAARRYRLCVKASEDQALRIITAFGSCLEGVFGSSADSLQRHLEEAEHLMAAGKGYGAQELLFQAADDCLIGQSFIFAVKVPDAPYAGASASLSHLIACQMIPVNNDPASSTILKRFRCLVEAVTSNSSVNAWSDLSADATHKGLWCNTSAESSVGSLQQSGNTFEDYWHRSLGLISSPTLNVSAESTSIDSCQSQLEEAKLGSRDEESKFQESMDSAQETLLPEDVIDLSTDHLCIPECSSLMVKNPPVTIQPLTGTSPTSHSLPQSPVSCCRPCFLRNSGSRESQDSSASLDHVPSKNIQTAEIHQAESGTWDEFLFSESLSEFIAKLENDERGKSNLSFKDAKLRLSGKKEKARKRRSETASDFIKTPAALLSLTQRSKKETLTETTARHGFGDREDNEFNTFFLQVPNEIVHIGHTSSCSENPGAQSSLGNLQGVPQRIFLGEFRSRDSFANEDTSQNCSKIEKSLLKNKIAPYLFTGDGDISLLPYQLAKNMNSCSILLDQSSSRVRELGHVDNRLTPQDEDLSQLRSESRKSVSVSCEGYNASADLFEASMVGCFEETLQSKLTRSNKRTYARETKSPRSASTSEIQSSGVVVHRRYSHFHTGGLQNCGTVLPKIQSLFPYFQSTPILRRFSESINDYVNIVTDEVPVFSVDRRSSKSLANFLLRKMRRSLTGTSSSTVCTISDNFRLFSPISNLCLSSEISSHQALQRRRAIVLRSVKKKINLEDQENCDVQLSITSCPVDVGCTFGRLESGIGTKCRMDSYDMNTVDNTMTTSPVMTSSHEFTVQKHLPNDWSPELFNEKSEVCSHGDTIQRRLF
ncbi:DNA damage-induced apoptosis suppressor protein-like isoform X1 [Hyperolius riggenbachi]|uniref:DNA damage-induced apoptosis suppressor protein-like isoform X1 n=1 Tax=Hyperolius riggenbachi TaxID=752182 RepID=UPI0035A3C915